MFWCGFLSPVLFYSWNPLSDTYVWKYYTTWVSEKSRGILKTEVVSQTGMSWMLSRSRLLFSHGIPPMGPGFFIQLHKMCLGRGKVILPVFNQIIILSLMEFQIGRRFREVYIFHKFLPIKMYVLLNLQFLVDNTPVSYYYCLKSNRLHYRLHDRS